MVDIEKAVRDVLKELENQPADSAPVTPTTPVTTTPTKTYNVPGSLEHSLLTVDMTTDALLAECRMARNCRIAAVCVAPYYVADAVSILRGSSVSVCAAIGFPNAFMTTEAKNADVRTSIMLGAAEIDLAINVAAVKSGDIAKAEKDFVNAAQPARGKAVVKAVIEHGSYDEHEFESVLQMIGRNNIPYIKIQNMTSGHGARVHEINRVRNILGDKVKIKIDGGVKSLEHALELLRAGADRIGLTATKKVAEEALSIETGGTKVD